MPCRKYFIMISAVVFPAIALVLLMSLSSGKSPGIPQPPAQDMTFIPGEGNMKPFFISICEETNINYYIYLEWLKRVYIDYPDVAKRAEPDNSDLGDFYAFNDPYLNSYMTHPALSYYPVTGVSWLQAQDYLSWKTDRLNEEILIREGFQLFNMNQVNDDHFNLEAYLAGQYEGLVKNEIVDPATGLFRKVKPADGLFYCGFRLPTEAEWDYVQQKGLIKPIDQSRSFPAFSRKAVHYPLGENYYTLRWGHILIDPYYFNFEGHDYPVDRNAAGTIPARVTSITDFDKNSPGVTNLDGNVKEWLLDEYSETPSTSIQDYIEILHKNGFPEYITTKDSLSKFYYARSKDSLGRMSYHSYGFEENGQEIMFANYDRASVKNRLIRGGTWRTPDIKNREFLPEDSSSVEVGFRAVTSYCPVSKEKNK
jgi:formylglycine-generating enzyme